MIPWLVLSWLTLLRTCVMCLQTQCSKPSVQIHTYDWYWRCLWVPELPWTGSRTRPSSWNSEASAVEEAKNAEEPAPEPKERTMAVVSLTWELGLIELAFRCEGIYSSEQWTATNRECCMRMLACLLAVKRFWKQRRGLYLTELQCLISSGHLEGLVHHHVAGHWRWWYRLPTFSSFGSASSLHCELILLCKLFSSMNISLCCGQNRVPGTTVSILALYLWENLFQLTLPQLTLSVWKHLWHNSGGWV